MKRLAVLLCFLTTAFLSTSTFAETTQIIFKGEASKSQQKRLTQIAGKELSQVRKLIPKGFTLPADLRIAYFMKDGRGEYVMEAHAVTIDASAPATQIGPQLAHELGHVVFEEAMDPFLPKDLASLHQQITALSSKAYQIQKTMTEQAQNGSLDYNKMNALLTEVNDQLSALPEFKSVLMTYHEFFADSFNVILSGNPKANLSPNDKAIAGSNIFVRDFSLLNTQSNLEIWKKDLTPGKSWGLSRHYAFAPARWRLWELIQNRVQNENEKTKLITAVTAGTLKAFSNFLAQLNHDQELALKDDPEASFYDLLFAADMEKLNAELSRSLEEALL